MTLAAAAARSRAACSAERASTRGGGAPQAAHTCGHTRGGCSASPSVASSTSVAASYAQRDAPGGSRAAAMRAREASGTRAAPSLCALRAAAVARGRLRKSVMKAASAGARSQPPQPPALLRAARAVASQLEELVPHAAQVARVVRQDQQRPLGGAGQSTAHRPQSRLSPSLAPPERQQRRPGQQSSRRPRLPACRVKRCLLARCQRLRCCVEGDPGAGDAQGGAVVLQAKSEGALPCCWQAAQGHEAGSRSVEGLSHRAEERSIRATERREQRMDPPRSLPTWLSNPGRPTAVKKCEMIRRPTKGACQLF